VSTRIPLTLACGDYEIIRPLKDGTVRPDGIDLTILTAIDRPDRDGFDDAALALPARP
jgi:4,5-dihydroxyphthalate decarboxylase